MVAVDCCELGEEVVVVVVVDCCESTEEVVVGWVVGSLSFCYLYWVLILSEI